MSSASTTGITGTPRTTRRGGLQLSTAQWLMLAAPLLLVLLAGSAAFGWIYAKHHRAQQQLDDMQPRYARLLGMQAQQDEIRQALQRIAAVKARHVYPGESDATQTGNALQQRLRDVFTQAGLSVLSSQVRIPAQDAKAEKDKEEAPAYGRVEILLSVDGSWEALQRALLAVHAIRPDVGLDEMRIMLLGNGANILIFLLGRITKGRPPVMDEAHKVFQGIYADPIPQALILTAIVISFGLTSFAIVLLKRVYALVDSDDLDDLNTPEEEEDL